MNYNNFRHLMKNTKCYDYVVRDNHTYPYISGGAETKNDIIVKFYSSNTCIQIAKDNSATLKISYGLLSRSIDLLNLITDERFSLEKKGTYKYLLTVNDVQGYMYEQTTIKFSPSGKPTIVDGLVIDDAILNAKTRALHAKTRKLRKLIQPKLRLTTTEMFINEINRGKADARRNAEVLVDLLEGKDLISNLTYMALVSKQIHLLGVRRTWQNGDGYKVVGRVRPKEIVDYLLRQIQAHKIEILEIYDERNSAS